MSTDKFGRHINSSKRVALSLDTNDNSLKKQYVSSIRSEMLTELKRIDVEVKLEIRKSEKNTLKNIKTIYDAKFAAIKSDLNMMAKNLKVEIAKADKLSLTADKHLDLQTKRIVQVGSPVDDTDCVNKKYLLEEIAKLNEKLNKITGNVEN